MKYIKSFIISGLAMISMGCGNYLDVQPQGKVLPKTEEEFASIIHNIIRNVEGGEDEYIIGNMEDIVRLEGIADDLDANIMAGSNLAIYAGALINNRSSAWRDHWTTVKDCNIVISNIPRSGSPVSKGTLSAAYAIKGIIYYNLMREWCGPWQAGESGTQEGLPIVDKFGIEAMPGRSTMQETADYILSLFDNALALDPQDGLYFFTEWVVKAYKARQLFWMERWDDCAALCHEIMTKSGLSIASKADFAAIVQAENDKLGEVIVRSHINNSSELDWYFTSVKKYITTRPAGKALTSLYDREKDVRWQATFDAKRFCLKAPESRLRLSEILLMEAECHAHLGENQQALDLLNQLRTNRIDDVVPLTLTNLPAVRTGDRITEDAEGKALTPLMQAVLDERRRELAMEGDRWWELKRNGCPEWWVVANGLKYTTKPYLYTSPIYKNDVELNEDLHQNPGYGN